MTENDPFAIGGKGGAVIVSIVICQAFAISSGEVGYENFVIVVHIGGEHDFISTRRGVGSKGCQAFSLRIISQRQFNGRFPFTTGDQNYLQSQRDYEK